jgi:glutamine amidotransferase
MERAGGIILPGVGAFGDAMSALRRLGLVTVLKDFAATGKPLFGICLGMQLVMSESYEFGHHEGLDLVRGKVIPFPEPTENGHKLKVPHVGWNGIRCPEGDGASECAWSGSLLAGVSPGAYQYFVHSFIVQPMDPAVRLAETRYGDIAFCSALRCGGVIAVQFHPERSGPDGLRIYRNFARFFKSRDSA